jgi:hypothetical protein
MKNLFARCLLITFAFGCLISTAKADLKIKSKLDVGGGKSIEQTTYIKGKRQRDESFGGAATLTQCDLHRTARLNTLTKTYFISPFGDRPSGADKPDA